MMNRGESFRRVINIFVGCRFSCTRNNKKVRSKYVPWITENIKQTMRRRDFLKKKAVKTGSKQFHDAYKRTRNDLNID